MDIPIEDGNALDLLITLLRVARGDSNVIEQAKPIARSGVAW